MGVAIQLMPVQPSAAQGVFTPFEIADNSFLVEEALNQEPGIFQNIFNLWLSEGGGWEAAFTQEWPLVTRTHQISYTVPYAAADGSTGLGDAFIHYRLQLLDGSGAAPAFSPRVSLILPSGRASRGLGNGSPGWEVNLPFSKQVRDVYLHWNAGFTHLPRAQAGGVEHNLLTPRLAGSAIWRARPMLNLMLEAVADWEEQPGPMSRARTLTIVPGVRTGWNVGDTQVIVGLGVPVTVTEDGRSGAAFLYFSYELPFTGR